MIYKRKKRSSKNTISHNIKKIDTNILERQEKYFELFVISIFLIFGIYHSILYFGHKIVPTSDFPAFVKTGHELLSFKIPSSFKRGPVVGLLQASLSYLVDFTGNQHPDLTAGRLLNAILHPFNLIFFYLVAKKLLGKPAIWFAIIAILNPWVIQLLSDPIAETTFLFFILITFYFIFRGSSWSYLFASITTMARYEGAALILAAFVMDVIYKKRKQQQIRAFIYSALASLPLAIWLVGTFLADTSSYLKVFGADSEYSKHMSQSFASMTGLSKHIFLEWQVAFSSLFSPCTNAGKETIKMLSGINQFFVAIGCLFGCIYGLFKRQWKILAMLIFFIPYIWIHSRLPAPLPRYHVPVFWISLLICLFGVQSLWGLINGKGRVPKWVVLILQGVVATGAAIWIVLLFPSLSKVSQMSPPSSSVLYVAISVVLLIFIGRVLIYKSRYVLRELSILLFACLLIVSNQFWLVQRVGDGQKEKEFKLLADWYVANAKENEKMGLYMSGMVDMFAPSRADNIISLPFADNPSEFVNECYKRDITYVVWATREGVQGRHTGYIQTNLHKTIAHLGKPKDIGPYQFVEQVGTKRGYVNIFRLRRPAKAMKQKLLTE